VARTEATLGLVELTPDQFGEASRVAFPPPDPSEVLAAAVAQAVGDAA
jgi:hypothetical protein